MVNVNRVVKNEIKKFEDNKDKTKIIKKSNELIIEFGFEIAKYHRQRSSRYSVYDPLGNYKKLIINNIIENMEKSNIKITEEEFISPIELDLLFINTPNFSNYSNKNILYKLIGLVKRTITPDLDNLAKTPMDILNNIAWKDDASIHKMSIEKRYGLEQKTLIKIKYGKLNNPSGRITEDEKEKYEKEIEWINKNKKKKEEKV